MRLRRGGATAGHRVGERLKMTGLRSEKRESADSLSLRRLQREIGVRIVRVFLWILLLYLPFDPTRARVVFVLCSFMFRPLDLSCYELYGPDACLICSTLLCASSALGSWSKLDLDRSKGCKANG